jgi:hypothetical protein
MSGTRLQIIIADHFFYENFQSWVFRREYPLYETAFCSFTFGKIVWVMTPPDVGS